MRFLIDAQLPQNISNRDLENLMRENLERVVSGLDEHDFVELDRTSLICHR